MAATIKHRFSSAVSDKVDVTRVRPQANWNDSLVVAGASGAGQFMFSRSSLADGWDFSGNYAGPYAIGGATSTARQLSLTGTFTSTGADARGFGMDSTLVGIANASSFGVILQPTLNKAGAGTHVDFVGLFVDAPAIGAGAATVTNASSLKINAAPTGATNNYALWVAGGNVRLEGANLGRLANTGLGPSLFFSDSQMGFRSGTAGFDWNNQADTLLRMRLTDGGILLVGTAVTTGAAAGEFVLGNSAAIRGVNAAGNNTIGMINLSSANHLALNANSLALDINSPLTQTTIGANGAASALTANPVGYLTVSIAGTTRIIPFYNP